MITNFVNSINKYLSNPKIIFDIGSRDAEQSIEFSKKYPNAKIYAFECNSATLPTCYDNSLAYKNIEIIPIAINSYDGNCKFYPINKDKTITSWSDGNPGASSLFLANGTYTHEKYIQDEIEVKCKRLDSFCREKNIDEIDIIWIDLQGAELIAFKSLGNLLKKVKIIHTEVSFKPIYTNQCLYNDINTFLIENNFINIDKDKININDWQTDLIYMNKMVIKEEIDIIIPFSFKDKNTLELCINGCKNVKNHRRIIIISDKKYSDSVEWFGENKFPFSYEDVKKKLPENLHYRTGWYFQQLLKLYSVFVIPNLTKHYLILDSDTIFLKPLSFIHNDKPLFNVGTEYHKPYFDHMKKLINLDKMVKDSGISHHMVFTKQYIEELFDVIKKYNSNENDVWKILLSGIDSYCGMSEYELYFNFIVKYHSKDACIRKLKWKNSSDLNDINNKDFDYISCHNYMREE